MEPILGRAYFTCAASQRQEQDPVSSCGRKPLRPKGLNTSQRLLQPFFFNGPTFKQKKGAPVISRRPAQEIVNNNSYQLPQSRVVPLVMVQVALSEHDTT